MNNNILKYSGITTKIKAMQSKLISTNEFIHLASLQTVSDFVTFLKQHPSYHHLFNQFDEHTLHRGMIESILVHSKYNDYAKIYRFATNEQRTFLDIYFLRFEIDILKTCLRIIFDERNISYDFSMLEDFFHSHSKLNLSSLFACNTIEELTQTLYNTEYFEIFSKITGEDLTLFDYELNLDIYYFSKFWKTVNKTLKGIEQKVITDLLGKEIDILNILWLYRSKRFFSVDSSKLYSYIIPINYKLKKKELHNLIETTTQADFLELLEQTYYKPLLNKYRKNNLDHFYHDVMKTLHRNSAKKQPYSISIITTYLYKKEEEIDRLTTVLECIRYQLSTQETLDYLTIL